MNKGLKRPISSKQVATTVFCSMVGVGIATLPRQVVQIASTSAWLVTAIAGLFPLLGAAVILILLRRHPCHDLHGLAVELWGPVLGWAPILLILIYSTWTSIAVIRSFAEKIQLILFQSTPLYMIIGPFVILLAYAVHYGVQGVARLNELLFWLLAPVPLLWLPALRQADLTNLLPLWPIDAQAALAGIWVAVPSYLGFEILLFLYWQVNEQAEIATRAVIAIAIVIVSYAALVLIGQLVLGLDMILLYTDPTITLTRMTRLPVIERLDLITILLYTGLAFRASTNFYFMMADTLGQILGRQRYTSITWLVALPLAIAALWPQNTAVTTTLFEQLGKLGVLTTTFMPLVLLLTSLVRRGRSR